MRYFLALFLLVFATGPMLADDGVSTTARKVAQADKPAKGSAAPDGEKLETDVLEFVRTHHPELADLLTPLKQSRPSEYQKAVRDLARVRDRLFAMQKNDNGRYDIELSLWKAETRVQLLAAQLQMANSDKLRDQLRAALGEQVDLRVELLKHERELVKLRVDKLDAQIRKLGDERNAAIDKQLQALANKSKASNKSGDKPVKTNNKPAK